MKKLVLALLVLGVSTSTFALKIGTVNTQALFSQYSQTKLVRETLSAEKKKLETELQKEEIELQKIQVELQGKGDGVTETEKKSFEERVTKFKNKVKESQTKLSQEEASKMQSIERIMNISIQNIAKTEKYDYILEQGIVKFGGTDVTQKVLKVMEKSKKIK